MDYEEGQLRRRFEALQWDRAGAAFAISIKLQVPDCFCSGRHAPTANRLIDDYRLRHPLDAKCFEYVQHESGPELLLCLGLAAAGVGLAREALSLVKSVVELVTTVVKARSEGQRNGDEQHGPMVILVRGLDANDAFYERHVLKVDLHTPQSEEAIGTSLTDMIQLIAEERARQERKGSDSLP
jgi:hypothetical protein